MAGFGQRDRVKSFGQKAQPVSIGQKTDTKRLNLQSASNMNIYSERLEDYKPSLTSSDEVTEFKLTQRGVKNFAKALFYGVTVAMFFHHLFKNDFGILIFSFFAKWDNLGMVLALSLALWFPAYFLAKLSHEKGVPRGLSDIGIGMVIGQFFCGGGAYLIGGLTGGFVFWHLSGYPDRQKLEAMLEER